MRGRSPRPLDDGGLSYRCDSQLGCEPQRVINIRKYSPLRNLRRVALFSAIPHQPSAYTNTRRITPAGFHHSANSQQLNGSQVLAQALQSSDGERLADDLHRLEQRRGDLHPAAVGCCLTHRSVWAF